MPIVRQPRLALNRAIAILLFCFLCNACDGGLFGTGDGDVETVDANGDITNPVTPPTSGEMDPDQVDEFELITTSFSFNNTLSGQTATSTPLIRLINLTPSSTLELINASNLTPVLSEPLPPNSVSVPGTIQLGDNNLLINTSDSNTSIASLFPLGAAENSLTSIIVYEFNPGEIDVVFLADETSSRSDNTALLRIVQLTPFQNSDSLGSLTLFPLEGSLGAAEQTFENISIQTREETPYFTVLPGNYQLIHNLNSIEPISVDLTAGNSYTIVLSNTLNPPALIINNSNL